MQAWRIKLITDSGEPLSWRSVILRVVGAFIAALPLRRVTLAIRQATPPLLARLPVGTRRFAYPKKGG